MPSLSAVRAFNDKVKTITTSLTAVFVGGTNGIGRATLVQLAKAKTTGLKVYIVGRNRKVQQTLLDELHRLNPKGNFIFLEAQIIQLADIKRVCDEIKSKEKSLDLLWMSAGALPFDGRKDTSEGLSMHMVLGYWGRMLFTMLLLPALKASSSSTTGSAARVVSILRAGHESSKLRVEDLDVKHSIGKSAHLGDYAKTAETMNTLFLEQLAQQNPDVVFVHKFPGYVKTSLFGQGWGASWSVKRVLFTYVVPSVVGIIGMSDEEVGMRCVYTLLSATYGGAGTHSPGGKDLRNSLGGMRRDGVFLVKENDEAVGKSEVLADLRSTGVSQRVYDETMRVLRPYMRETEGI